EFEPYRTTLQVESSRVAEVTIPLARWIDLASEGWYSGNTHVHYNEKEDRPDERLRLDPVVHDLCFTAISHVQRWDVHYASNKYPLGALKGFSTRERVVCCGQENRHNIRDWEIGYGHVLLLKLNSPVLPISRGLLVDEGTPDYPPLCHDLTRAKEQGGVTLWCHNGMGMEAPVAAILGKVDAFNLFDTFLYSPEGYRVWYDLLNCGIRLPASTGSDWFVCSNNRVYVCLQDGFTHDSWLEGLKAGRSFITNGPALFLKVNGNIPGSSIPVDGDGSLGVEVTWKWHQPLELLELVWNGEVIASVPISKGNMDGDWRRDIPLREDGWLVARLYSSERDSFFQPIFAHTSPVWVQAGRLSQACRDSTARLVYGLEEAMDWISSSAKFENPGQRADVLELYERAIEMAR
ncbi:MAG: CehA/McbA family metallohydrolase, partial [Candidatus Atribacteria bacterium]|nr:CehA/McbA family metallohydrolase [Candidatus Atribacteria bacterium]